MRELIAPYLETKESAWASSTWRSERSRLNAVSIYLGKTPAEVHKIAKKTMKPYTVKTLFIRLADMESWSKKDYGYRKYLHTHKNLFKHAYHKKEIGVDYETAVEAIRGLPGTDPARAHSLGILRTGCRLDESYRVSDGIVKGKGGKSRKIFGTIEVTVPKSTLSRKLKAVGLTPHMLRKLCATRLAEKGASPADLCKVFGWSSISTAYRYLQPKDDAKLAALMEAGEKGSERGHI